MSEVKQKKIPNVLILCTGNSCRSQMAEAILNHYLFGKIHVFSAGINPQTKVADGAITALKDLGIQTDGLYPKKIDLFFEKEIDLIITVCDNAKESCPIFPRPIPKIHIPFHDPHGESLESFFKIRDEIINQLIKVVKDYFVILK